MCMKCVSKNYTKPNDPKSAFCSNCGEKNIGMCKLTEAYQKEIEKLCIVCNDGIKEFSFYPCRHLCICKKCAEKYQKEK